MNMHEQELPESTPVAMSPARRLQIDVDPRLIEEAVLRVLQHDLSHEYWSKRELAYQIADVSRRNHHFAELSHDTFFSLNLHRPLRATLEAHVILPERLSTYRVTVAQRKKNVGAELYVTLPDDNCPGGARNLIVRLQPEMFADLGHLTELLQSELYYIRDMLDPEFEYDPSIPEAEGGPMHADLILKRYRAVWKTSVQGRLMQGRSVSNSEQAPHLREFARAFGMLGEATHVAFFRWFNDPSPNHRDMMRFARRPRDLKSRSEIHSRIVDICPLCSCPGEIFALPRALCKSDIGQHIKVEFPEWKPEDGLCAQCLDQYHARTVSRMD